MGNRERRENETHFAIAKAAGYQEEYNFLSMDIVKVESNTLDKYNHFFNNVNNIEITPEIVLNQVKRYNDPNDHEGHLYGAIIATFHKYKEIRRTSKTAEYYIALCAHYIGDLSQPLHNIPYDDFNEAHHVINDKVVEDEVLENVPKIERNMYPIIIRPENIENDLANEIARIANISRNLGITMKKENRDMSKEEAYEQLGRSASLLKAILKYFEESNNANSIIASREDSENGGFKRAAARERENLWKNKINR